MRGYRDAAFAQTSISLHHLFVIIILFVIVFELIKLAPVNAGKCLAAVVELPETVCDLSCRVFSDHDHHDKPRRVPRRRLSESMKKLG